MTPPAKRTLYFYRFSPYSRRVRLALAHKGLDAELREGRDSPAHIQEAHALVPTKPMPVLVDQGRAMADSTAIVHWLDRAYPHAPRLVPDAPGAADVLQTMVLVDVVLDNAVNLGTRYWALRGDPAWETVKTELVGRARGAAEALGARVAALGRPTVDPSGWSAADMWLVTAALWFETMPRRAPTTPNIAQVMSLGITLPQPLTAWVEHHRHREDVQALGEPPA
jgi:glutathione S-transferase